MSLSIEKKDQIRDMLGNYCDRYPSIEKAANSLNHVSQTTVYNILRSKYDSIRDQMFRTLRNQIEPLVCPQREWALVQTPTFKDVHFCLRDAHLNNNVTWLVAPSGSGKTVTAEAYVRENKNVFYVLCDEDMGKTDFVAELAKSVGLKIASGRRRREKLLAVLDEIGDLDNALIILDEGDKLRDDVLCYFITIYNRLREKAGIVFLSTPYIKTRIESSLNRQKKGFEEIHSRIDRNYYNADLNTENDVYAICKANGIEDEKMIQSIISDTARYGYDLRRVKKRVKAMRDKAANRIEVE